PKNLEVARLRSGWRVVNHWLASILVAPVRSSAARAALDLTGPENVVASTSQPHCNTCAVPQ
ncbi:hypothetical protein NJH54_27130, partial [Pseudomonas asiatica]|uniref:hypothetical protein n=1 Tax=Pseudomonas asiatica TaxID=2219225 RepID=UPI00209B82EB